MLECVTFSMYSQQYTHEINPSLLHEPSSKPERATIEEVHQAIAEGESTTMYQGLLDGITRQTMMERDVTE